MKNKTLAILILLCNLLTPSSFATRENCKSLSKYSKVEFIKNRYGGEKYALLTLEIISDKLNKLLNLMKKERDANQQQEYLKDLKFLTFFYGHPSVRSKSYIKEDKVNQLFKGLDDFMFHPIYMLVNPGSGLNFGWITCKNLPEMVKTFVAYIDEYEKSGYFDDKFLFYQHLRIVVGSKLAQILEIKDFYKIYAKTSQISEIVFENIMALIRIFGMPEELAHKHIEFVVKYMKSLVEEDEKSPSNDISKEDKKYSKSKSYEECLEFLKHERYRERQTRKERFLQKIRGIVVKNMECFTDSEEGKLIAMLKTR